jgi:hypothetical protein
MNAPAPPDFAPPDLRFVPVDALIPHEQHDAHRLQALVSRLRAETMLRNPPVVAPLDRGTGESDMFVVLDGANRASAAHALGWPHMLVQVVSYREPAVHLSTWCHALGDYSRADFEALLRAVPGLECRGDQPLHASAVLARRDALAEVVFADGVADTLHGGRDLREHNTLLNAVVDTYRASKRFYRVTSESIDVARTGRPDVTALVVFPHFEPAEVIELASCGERLPAGITRHVIRWRALRINMPIERLADTRLPIDAKNAWLKTWLHEKLIQREVRSYEEPTVLFDE